MSHSLRHALFVFALLSGTAAADTAINTSPIQVGDHTRFAQVSSPQVSPDGQWVLYSVTRPDFSTDRYNTDLWVVRWDGSQRRQLTFSSRSESAARWRPDGKAISYLQPAGQGGSGAQVFVQSLDQAEPEQLTRLPGRISAYEWSPDGTRLALVYRAPEEKSTSGEAGNTPHVIDRYLFKRDGQGYLTGKQSSRIHLYDLASKDLSALTVSEIEERQPTWSPDGRWIAYVSNHDQDPDRSRNDDVFVVASQPGGTPRALTQGPRIEGQFLAWSPDSRLIAFGLGSDQALAFHNQNQLAIVPAQGGDVRVLSEALDRSVSAALFSADGKHLRFLVGDDRDVYLAEVPTAGGAITRLVPGQYSLSAPAQGGSGRIAAIVSTDANPGEVHALEGKRLRPLSDHNAHASASLPLQTTQRIEFDSADGTRVHALLTLPPGHTAGTPLPTIVWIHGGPNAQDTHGFRFERQLFAAHGFAVVNINYRGSNGRGVAFGQSIAARWGQLEVQDVLAGVEYLVAQGIADPDRLGLGGWSYGGLLTDFVIASDTRFKAAISGAGSANNLGLYGHNQYIHLYDSQFGHPWENTEAWLKLSYPFFEANKITTPTLFLGGDQDFNVPIIGSEQMYQALKALGVDTQLIVYPGENHRLTKISFENDRYQRYLDWFQRYLSPDPRAAAE